MAGVLSTVVGMLVFVLALAMLIVFAVSSLALLQRRGRWRGRKSYLVIVSILIVCSLLVGSGATSADSRVADWAETDLGTASLWLVSVLACGAVSLVVCWLLPSRRRVPISPPGRLLRATAKGLRLVGTALVWAAVPLGIWFGWWARSGEGPIWAVILFLLCGASAATSIAVVGSGLNYVASRLVPPSLAEWSAADARPPVLYLRGFGQEESWFARDDGGEGRTFEQFLGPAIRDQLGPLVALGSPRDRLAPDGAIRVYCSDQEWRPTAERLMATMRCAMLTPASTLNVAWEVGRLVQLDRIGQLFVLLPPASLEVAESAAGGRSVTAALRSALGYYLSPQVAIDDDVIQRSSAVGPPSAFAPLPLVDEDRMAQTLRSAGLTPLDQPPGPGSVIGIEDRQVVLLATGLTTPDEYVATVTAHLAASG